MITHIFEKKLVNIAVKHNDAEHYQVQIVQEFLRESP